MKKKIRKVIIKEEMSSILLFGIAIFATAAFFIIVTNYRAELSEARAYILIIMVMFWIGTIYNLKECKNGLYNFVLTQDYITFCNYKNNKKEKTSIKLSDISAFRLDIWHRENFRYMPHRYDACQPFDIKINIQVTTYNNETYQFSYSEQERRRPCAKNIFAVAKFIPNFSYTVDTNNDVFKSGLDATLQKENLSWWKRLEFVLNDPRVSKLSKTHIKITLGILAFFIWLISMMIIKTIVDIIG